MGSQAGAPGVVVEALVKAELGLQVDLIDEGRRRVTPFSQPFGQGMELRAETCGDHATLDLLDRRAYQMAVREGPSKERRHRRFGPGRMSVRRGEIDPFGGEAVDVGSQCHRVPIDRQTVRPQRVDDDQDDIGPFDRSVGTADRNDGKAENGKAAQHRQARF